MDASQLVHPDIVKVLQNTAESILRDIASAQDISEDFVVSVSPTLLADASISAGFPPIITIRSLYLADFVNTTWGDDKKFEKAKKRMRRDFASVISKIPRMEESLSNTPPARMIVMREGKWYKTNDPSSIAFVLPDSYIEIEESYTVKMREVNSGVEVSLTGKNPTVLHAQCKQKLTSLVDTHYAVLEKIKKDTAPVPIASIDIKFSKSEELSDQVKFNYLDEEKKE